MGLLTIDERKKTVDIDMDYRQIRQADVNLLHDMTKLGYNVGEKTQQEVYVAQLLRQTGDGLENIVKVWQVAPDCMSRAYGKKS